MSHLLLHSLQVPLYRLFSFMVNFFVLILVECSLELVSLVSFLLPLWESAFYLLAYWEQVYFFMATYMTLPQRIQLKQSTI